MSVIVEIQGLCAELELLEEEVLEFFCIVFGS
jgi:hypothetical protein